MSITVLSAEESRERCEQDWKCLKPQRMFEFRTYPRTRIFIAVNEQHNDSWEVIEFTKENVQRILQVEPAIRSSLRLEDAYKNAFNLF